MKKLIFILLLSSCSSIKPTIYEGRYKPQEELPEIPSPVWMVVMTATLIIMMPK